MLLDYSSLLLGGVVCAKQYLLSQVGMSGGDVGDTASSSSASFSSGASALLARDGSDIIKPRVHSPPGTRLHEAQLDKPRSSATHP